MAPLMMSLRGLGTSLVVSVLAVHAVNALSFPDPSGYKTKSYDVDNPEMTPVKRTDFSDETLSKFWDYVGPVSTGSVTTTVSPTPEPSTYAHPAEFHPLVASNNPGLADVKLPKNFKWGIAASSYQIEGATKSEGKGPHIWDLLSHRVPNWVVDNTTGDVLSSHYWLYKQDIARMKNLGIKSFSPSFSWARFFPFGRGPVNEQAVQHYDDVISELVKAGIEPVVTLFHWETPLPLFWDYGAWNNEQIIEDFFNYCKFVISRYDAYVPIWYTLNEPQYCNWQWSTYPAGEYYPAINNITAGLKARFLCGHYTNIAMAKVAKWYHEEFKGRGRITFKNSGNYFQPMTNSQADKEATQRNYDFALGWFGGCWTDGDYPASLKETLGDLLPKFTEEEKKLIKGSCDFYAIDGYTSYNAEGIKGGVEKCISSKGSGYPECAGAVQTTEMGFPVGPAADPGASWLVDAPSGIRKLLKTIVTDLFPSVPDIVVSEFGFSEPFESEWTSLAPALWDLKRADYIQNYMDNILLSIHADKVNVTGAFAWSIFDNFEWNSGTKTRFGLQFTDYKTLKRTPKASMFQLLHWFKQHT